MLSEVLKERFGTKVYKLSLTSGCTCPNRDGHIRMSEDGSESKENIVNGGNSGISGQRLTGGCTFCSEGGSGEFAAPLLPLEDQIRLARQRVDAKIPARIPMSERKYIAYFQSFSNTYARNDEELARLRNLYMEAVRRPEIVALSLGTRPDCLPPEILDMLRDLNEVKPVWVELGLQTIHERTAAAIHRGYSLPVFEEAVRNLKGIGVEVIVHVILGLPGESREDMLDTIRYLARMHVQGLQTQKRHVQDKQDPSMGNITSFRAIDGIKLQQLQILRGTQMAREYEKVWPGEGTRVYEEAREKTCPDDGNRERLHIFSLEEYCELIRDCLGILPEDIVIHRLTGDAPKSLLIEPAWCADKKRVLNTLRRYMV